MGKCMEMNLLFKYELAEQGILDICPKKEEDCDECVDEPKLSHLEILCWENHWEIVRLIECLERAKDGAIWCDPDAESTIKDTIYLLNEFREAMDT